MKGQLSPLILAVLSAKAAAQLAQGPGPVTIQRVGASQYNLTWYGEYLRPYQIEGGPDLLTWAEVGPMQVGTGALLGYTHTNTAAKHFYRVREGAMRPGFDDVEFERNDDLTYPFSQNGNPPPVPVAIGFPVLFFGQTYTHCFVNNNGNITFDEALWEYTPFNLGELNRVIIAPFWADVDTRLSSDPDSQIQSALARFSGTPGVAGGRSAFGVTWPGVGYYDSNLGAHVDKLNSFQMLLIDRSDLQPGDFDIEFNYNQILWETWDVSGGAEGFGGSSARVGLANGTSRFMEYKGSGQTLAFLDKKPGQTTPNYADGLKFQMWNSTVPGRIVIPVRGGIPIGESGNEFQVNAGTDQSLALGAGRTATLTGTITPANVSGLTYQWTQVDPAFPLAEITTPDSPDTSVVIREPGEFVFRFTAFKQGMFFSSSSDEIKVTHPDIISVFGGGFYYFETTPQNIFQLDWASAEYNGSPMADVEWTQTSGDPCSISDPLAIIPEITFPGPGWYSFTLTGRSGGLPNWEQSSTVDVLIEEPIAEP